jgi:hypothetical protein
MAHAFASAGAAATLAAISFIALREKYRDECLWIRWHPAPDASYDAKFLFLNFFALLFFVCFVWLGIELARTAGALIGATASAMKLAAIGAVLACSLYVVVAAATWEMNPIPGNDDTTWRGTRLYLSVFWPLGLLQESGDYRYTFCGE